MRKLPFNPELLLSLFMSENSARSLAGDLEERFQRTWAVTGFASAVIRFWLEILLSIPPLLSEAVGLKLTSKTPPPDLASDQSLQGLTPSQFELLVADRLRRMDYAVRLGNGANHPDGGIDIIAITRSPFASPVAIQVKHHY